MNPFPFRRCSRLSEGLSVLTLVCMCWFGPASRICCADFSPTTFQDPSAPCNPVAAFQFRILQAEVALGKPPEPFLFGPDQLDAAVREMAGRLETLDDEQDGDRGPFFQLVHDPLTGCREMVPIDFFEKLGNQAQNATYNDLTNEVNRVTGIVRMFPEQHTQPARFRTWRGEGEGFGDSPEAAFRDAMDQAVEWEVRPPEMSGYGWQADYREESGGVRAWVRQERVEIDIEAPEDRLYPTALGGTPIAGFIFPGFGEAPPGGHCIGLHSIPAEPPAPDQALPDGRRFCHGSLHPFARLRMPFPPPCSELDDACGGLDSVGASLTIDLHDLMPRARIPVFGLRSESGYHGPTDLVYRPGNGSGEVVQEFGPGWNWIFETGLQIQGPAVLLHTPSGEPIPFIGEHSGAKEYATWPGTGYALDHPDSRTWRLTTPLRRLFTFSTFNDGRQGMLTSIKEPSGASTLLRRDGDGRLLEIVLPEDRSARITDRNDCGRIAAIRLEDGRVTRFGYDADGRLQTVTQPDGHLVKLAYQGDSSDILCSLVEAEHCWTVSINGSGFKKVIDLQAADGGVTHFEESGAGNLVLFPDGSEILAQSVMTIHGMKMAARAPISAGAEMNMVPVSYAYDACGAVSMVTEKTDPEAIIRRKNSNTGMPLEIVHPGGGTETFVYAEDGLGVLSHRSPAGDLTEFEYDAAGREIRRTVHLKTARNRSVDLITETVHDIQSGRPKIRRFPGGAEERTEFDEFGRIAARTDRYGERTDYTYDAGGRIRSEKTSYGFGVTYSYDALDRIIEKKFHDGTRETLEYSHLHKTAVTDRLGRRTEFEHDYGGNLVKTILPNGGVLENRYDEMGRIIQSIDPLGRMTRFQRIPKYRQVWTERPDGEIQVETLDSGGRISSITAADGRMTVYLYDVSGNLTAVEHPTGMIETRECDAGGRLVRKETFPYGLQGQKRVTEYRYDALNRLIIRREPDGGAELFEFGARGLVMHRDVEGGIFRDQRDKAGRLVARTDPDHHTIRFYYGKSDRPITAIDDLGRRWTWEYDEEWRVTLETGPDGSIRRWDYDPAGQIVRVSDGGGDFTRFEYDECGRLIEAIDSLGQRKTMRRNLAGELIGIEGPDGSRQWFQYDLLGRRCGERSNFGPTIERKWAPAGLAEERVNGALLKRFDYNESGFLLQEWASGRPATRYTYNLAGERTGAMRSPGKPFEAQNMSWAYDPCGRLIRRTTAESGAWSYRRLPGGRILSVQAPDATNVRMQYSASGRLIRLSDASGDMARYAYDAAGRLVQMIDMFGIMHFVHDANANEYREIDPYKNEVFVRSDQEGRPLLIRRRTASGNEWVVRYRYDRTGRLVEIEDGSGRVWMDYRPGHERPCRVEREGSGFSLIARRPGGETTLIRHYNGRGERIGQFGYHFDEEARVDECLSDLLGTIQFARNEAGRLCGVKSLTTQQALRDAVESKYLWDPFGNLLSANEGHRTLDSSTGPGNQLGYAILGQRWDLLAPIPNVWEGEVSAWFSHIYFRPGDSWIAVPPEGLPVFPGTSTQILLIQQNPWRIQRSECMAPPVYGDLSLEFDQRGNLVSRGGFAFHYNSLNQLVQAETPDGGRWVFVYDGLGRRRMTKCLDSSGTILKHVLHLYFGRLRIEDQDLVTGESVRYIRGQDLSGTMEDAGGAEGLHWAVFSSRPTVPFYYLHDGRGNCTGLLCPGSEDWDARYTQTAMGVPIVDQQQGLPADQPFRMQGKAWIAELGLYDFGARLYDPFLARWLTPDPKMEDAGWNLYEPFQGDPVDNLDPWGRDIFVMIDDDAVLRQGHVALTIGQPGESYQYFSFEKGCSVLTVKDNLEGLFFPSLQTAVEGLPRYDRYMVYKCPPDQDRAALRAAMQWMNARYNLFNNNCKDFVRDVLSAIGKETQNAWQPIIFMDKNRPGTLVPSHSGAWDWNEMQGKRYLFMPWSDYFDEFENDSIRPPLVPPMRAN